MNKTLICYFSASGVTKKEAERIAALVNGTLFEIEPVDKYTAADLDWMDKESRSTKEMQDEASRPKVVRKVDGMDEYDKVIVGFPVWWYVAPRIINTFIEENDLTNKKVYVFVTSGSSSFANSLKDLREKYPNINFVNGIRITNSTSDDEINTWLN